MEPNQNSSSMLNNIPRPPQEKRNVGPIIGALVIVLIIIIAALYFFGRKLNTTPITIPTPIEREVVATTTSKINSTNTNDAAVIEADLNTQLKDVDYSF